MGAENVPLFECHNVFRTNVLTGDAIFTSPTGDGTAILRGHREPRVGLAKCLVAFPVQNDPGRPVNHYNSNKSQWRIQGRGTGPRPPPPAYFFKPN